MEKWPAKDGLFWTREKNEANFGQDDVARQKKTPRHFYEQLTLKALVLRLKHSTVPLSKGKVPDAGRQSRHPWLTVTSLTAGFENFR